MSEVKPLLIEIGTEVEADALTRCVEAHRVRGPRVRQDVERQCTMDGLCDNPAEVIALRTPA